MIEYLILVAAVFVGAIKSVLNRKVKNGTTTLYGTLRLNLISFFFAFLAVFFIGIGKISTLFVVPFWLTLFTAVCTVGMQICMMKAVQLGPVSLSSFFLCSGFIIPTAWGAIYYQERFHLVQGIGVLLILVAFTLSVSKEKDKKCNVVWLLYALGSMFFSGFLGVCQKLFAKEYPNCSVNNFLTVSFFIVLVFLSVCTLITYFCEREKSRGLGLSTGKLFAYTIPLGVIIGGLMLVNTYLFSVLPSVVSFPAVNGGTIFITTILSAVIFKEKPTKRQTIALCIGIGAILLIALAQLF